MDLPIFHLSDLYEVDGDELLEWNDKTIQLKNFHYDAYLNLYGKTLKSYIKEEKPLKIKLDAKRKPLPRWIQYSFDEHIQDLEDKGKWLDLTRYGRPSMDR